MDLVTIKVAKAFELTLDSGERVFVPEGNQAVSPEVAEHWYTKAHLHVAPPPALGDYEYAQTLRAAADAKRAEADAIEAQALEAEEAFQAKNAEALAAAKAASKSTLPAEPASTEPAPKPAPRPRATTKSA